MDYFNVNDTRITKTIDQQYRRNAVDYAASIGGRQAIDRFGIENRPEVGNVLAKIAQQTLAPTATAPNGQRQENRQLTQELMVALGNQRAHAPKVMAFFIERTLRQLERLRTARNQNSQAFFDEITKKRRK